MNTLFVNVFIHPTSHFFLNEKVQIHFSTYWNFFSYICYLLPPHQNKIYMGGVTEGFSDISCFKFVSSFKWPSTTEELWILSVDVIMPMSPLVPFGKSKRVYIFTTGDNQWMLVGVNSVTLAVSASFWICSEIFQF